MSSFKTMTCNKHGEYQAEVTVAGSGSFEREFCTGCPKCEIEKIETNINYANSLRDSSISGAFKKANIPIRYQDCSIYEIVPSNEDQKKIIDRCKSYISKYNELKKFGTSLIFTGKPGTGKTKIALSMVKPIISGIINPLYDNIIEEIRNSDGDSDEILRSFDYNVFNYINTYDLFMEIKSTYNKNSSETEKNVIDIYTNTEILILDEVGAQSGSDYETTTMFRIINARYENLKPTFLISNLSEEDLSQYIGERTIDRFYENHGAVFVFDWDSYRRI